MGSSHMGKADMENNSNKLPRGEHVKGKEPSRIVAGKIKKKKIGPKNKDPQLLIERAQKEDIMTFEILANMSQLKQ